MKESLCFTKGEGYFCGSGSIMERVSENLRLHTVKACYDSLGIAGVNR